MKLFVDDIRDTPDSSWLVARTYRSAIHHLKRGDILVLSLDHDLGDWERTGYDICKWIEEQVAINGFRPPRMQIHSANPVGRKNMQAAIESIERLSKNKVENVS